MANGSDGHKRMERFNPEHLYRALISLPLEELLRDLADGEDVSERFVVSEDKMPMTRISLIVELNLEYQGGLSRARHRVFDLLVRIAAEQKSDGERHHVPTLDRISPRSMRATSEQYVFAWLTPDQIHRLVALERRSRPSFRAIHRLWPDNVVRAPAYGSMATIKADAATATFGCSGKDIVWAVIDSGIDGAHPHFQKAGNLQGLPSGISHLDFVSPGAPAPLVDLYGHGTHVAGIIAGSLCSDDAGPIAGVMFERGQDGVPVPVPVPLSSVSGVAPECKLVSFKVLGDKGKGGVTGLIAALEEIHRANGYGKFPPRIHGVNMSLGYPFEPRWFACGHSPLCDVVDRLAKSGVVVVVSAGNNGYGMTEIGNSGMWGQGLSMTITDPGNAEHAITVGSTHRDSPHMYGVSYFSSKGPTGDGRNKPDLLAPGEKILSCASTAGGGPALYREDSGTSMAAPHVSGAIAAFLSVRREFIGNSITVKEIFLKSALDLKRDQWMQGNGLLDLLRALQSV